VTGGDGGRRMTGGRWRWYRSVTVHLVILVLSSFTGCTCRYSFSQSSLPTHIRSVAIPVLGNETVEPGLEQELSEAIARQFLDDGTLRVVPENEADSAIYGVVTRYVNQVFGYNADEQTEEYEVVIELSVEFKDLVKRKTRWQDESMVGRTTYFVVGPEAQDEVSGRAGAIERLAQDILNRTVRSW
jgi:hypothetical protein